MIGVAIVSGKPAFKDFVASMKPTDTKPGTQFNYQSVNTQVLGLLLEKVTGHRLNQYTEEKLWKKIGAQSGAFFLRSEIAARYLRFRILQCHDSRLWQSRFDDDAWKRIGFRTGRPRVLGS
jgi:CubicO group peptidase (beta-lactamase class C family)